MKQSFLNTVILLILFFTVNIHAKGTYVLQTVKSSSWNRATHGYIPILARTIKEKYNNKNIIILRTTILDNKKLYEKSKFLYKNNTLSQIQNFNYNDVLSLNSKLIFKKQTVTEKIFDSSGNLIWNYLYSIDNSGNIIKRQCFDKNGKLLLTRKSSYDDVGNVIYHVTYYNKNRPLHVSQFEYSKKNRAGNWLEQNEVQYYSDVRYAPKETIIRDLTHAPATFNKKLTTGKTSTTIDFPSLSPQDWISYTELLSKKQGSGSKVLKKALIKIKAKTIIKGSCYDWINLVYKEAGFSGKTRKSIFHGKEIGPYADTTKLKAGDWVMFKNMTYGKIGHSGIFVEWIDYDRRSAILIGYAGQKRTLPGRFREYDISRLFGIIRGVD